MTKPSAVLAVVVDTNILVRALIKPKSSDGQIFRLVLDEKLELYFSQALLAEITRVLTYPRLQQKYHLTPRSIATFLHAITTFGKLVAPTQTITLCRDPDDNELLSLAASAPSSAPIYVVTADHDLLMLKGAIKAVTIATPQEFLKKLKGGQL